jgi:hypothetical protein
MKIKEKYIVYISVAIILIVAGYWIWYDNKTVDFHVDEFFADSSYNGKINFNFVSVDKYDEVQMLDFAKQISTENLTLDMLRRDLPMITVVHFYKISDTAELDEKMIQQIQRQYPHITEVKNSLQSVPSGYIYTGFSKYIHNLKLPKDTMFQTSVIIPKNGIKAKDILKVNKTKNSSDSLKVNNENLRKK